MNIFYLHNNPTLAARMHCDKHVVKMILEYAQILSTNIRLQLGREQIVYQEVKGKYCKPKKRWLLPEEEDTLVQTGFKYPYYDKGNDVLYAVTHRNHPSTVWSRKTKLTTNWTYDLFVALCKEYTHRYSKVHKTSRFIPKIKGLNKFLKYEDTGMVQATQAMPEDVKHFDSVIAYRQYYRKYKLKMLKYKNREVPSFLKDIVV